MAISASLVLHPFEFFATRDDSSVTLAPEGRQILAPCRSWQICYTDPGLRRSVGQPILAAAGFQPALAWCDDSRLAGKSRLKGRCGQDCPPHNTLAGAHHQHLKS